MASPPPSPQPPVGEDNWLDYIDQQHRGTSSLEKRILRVELYRSAVNAEPGSIRLWVAYCEYFWSLHLESQHHNEAGWSADEQAAGREIFSLDAALHLWSEGHDATKYRLDDSHVLWNRWIALEKELLDKTRTPDGVKRITHLYRNRLLAPHATWDDTAQMFSGFLSEYQASGYEEVMRDITDRAGEAKSLYAQRDPMETRLRIAAASADADEQRAAMAEYLRWEIANTKKERKNQAAAIQLGLGLFSRALTGLFVHAETTWTDFIVYVSDLRSVFAGGPHKDESLLRLLPNSLDALQRAVQHCPWSGPLWARYILGGEEAGLAFSDMERIKHAATNSSQLDRDGMTAVVDMYAAWCGYLKRSAMHINAADEAVDIADSGLVAALEAVQVWGERRFGDAYRGDPNYRLERILIQYLTEKHDAIDEARSQWQKLASRDLYANSYDFWLSFFMWEMLVFQAQKGKDRSPTPGASARGLRVPTLAAGVLERAIHNRKLDWPERVMEVYLHHCNDYQTSDTVRRALDTVHKVKQGVARRREREAAENAALYAAQAESAQPSHTGTGASAAPESPSGSKRKRGTTPDNISQNGNKRIKGDSGKGDAGEGDPPQHTTKRDRENTMVFVTNLPLDVTATKVKSYFREYGHVNSLQVRKEDDQKSAVALVEFRSPEDVLSALIRDGKYFEDRQIAVKPATNLTLFVTNFPPTADEAYIRSIFEGCGEVFAVRRPSLRYNTHRRFCYVTFRDQPAAARATKLHGKVLEDQYQLSVMYSDPSAKKSRDGATSEGREVHVKNLSQDVDEEALEDVFSKYGTVLRVRLLRKLSGQSRGSAFVVFEHKEDADRAVAELHNTKLRSRIIEVEISILSTYKPSARTQGAGDGGGSIQGDKDDDNNSVSSHGISPEAHESRTFALLGIPETVNIARVRALVEPHGSIVKLVLRPDHGGAIVELADATAAGKAQLSLAGKEIDGQMLRVGTVAELFGEKPRKDTEATNEVRGHALRAPPPRVKRPLPKQGGIKRGVRPGFPRPAAPAASGEQPSMNGGQATASSKKNDDFRKMFLGSGSVTDEQGSNGINNTP